MLCKNYILFFLHYALLKYVFALTALCKKTHLLNTLTFGDPLISDFDPWVTQALQHVSRVQAHQICNLVHICNNTTKVSESL